MYFLIGDKKIFAIDVSISKNKWDNQIALWINNTKIGDWDERVPLAPFVNSLSKVINDSKKLWLDELEGKSCYDMFLFITPLYNEPDSFYDLNAAERRGLYKFDRFLFNWGENFDSWDLKVVVNGNVCTFLWVHTPNRDSDSFEVRNNVQCFSVDQKIVTDCYEYLTALITTKFDGNVSD